MTKWILRSRYWMASKPSRPGVWRLKDGGWFVRARGIDPKTGHQIEVSDVRREGTADEAFAWLRQEMKRVRDGSRGLEAPKTRFCDFAVSLLERKIARGDIWSPRGRGKWTVTLEHHLLPVFGEVYVDRLSRDDIDAWMDKVSARIARGELSAATANTHLAILRVISGAAFARNPGADPMLGVTPFRQPPGRETYTDDHPNSLRPDDVPRFVEEVRRSWPQHFAMVTLGFCTGLRPSSLRPLRRTGPFTDVLWEEAILLVRRSQTDGEAVERTKTGTRQRLHLPSELVDVLRWHCTRLTERQLASDLLFPSETGGFRSGSVLDKPFTAVAAAIGLPYRVTARAMRRTFQDLARAAAVADVVTRSVSGHATEAMQRHYSTVNAGEQRAALARVIKLARVSV
jgi:integrase